MPVVKAVDNAITSLEEALSWGKFAGSKAPASLTQTQLIQIYTCDPATGTPPVSSNNWPRSI